VHLPRRPHGRLSQDHAEAEAGRPASRIFGILQELNKRTHVRPDTILTDSDEIEEFANVGIAAPLAVFETMDEVHQTIVEAIAKELHGEATSAIINETIQELGEIAGRNETEIVWVEGANVVSVDADMIQYQVSM
jgi:hypothetical protein